MTTLTADTLDDVQPASRTRYRLTVWALRLLVIVLPIMVWEYGVTSGRLDPFLYSQPSRIFDQLSTWWTDGTIIDNVWFTLRNAVLGYVIGMALGVGLAVLFVAVPAVGHTMTPFMTAINAIPRFAFAPLLVALWGFGFASNVALVVLVILFVVFFSIYSGLTNLEQAHLDWARTLGASTWHQWTTVRFPAIVRWVLASLRLSIGLSVSAAIVSEFVGGARGIGYLVSFSVNLFRASGVYAGMVVVLIMAAIIDSGLRWAERRFTHWTGQ